MEARKFLGSIPFFAEVLSGPELDTLAAAARHVEFDQGSTLISEREFGDSLFVIMSGTATVSIHDSGKDRLVTTLHAGDVIGEMSLLTGDPRAATVAAQSPVVALEITQSAIEPLFRKEPSLCRRFAAMLEKRRIELDRLYGPGLWPFSGPPRANVAAVIRSFFDGLRNQALR